MPSNDAAKVPYEKIDDDLREVLEYVESCDAMLDEVGIPTDGPSGSLRFKDRLLILIAKYKAVECMWKNASKCANCNGSGRVFRHAYRDYIECPSCGGKGH